MDFGSLDPDFSALTTTRFCESRCCYLRPNEDKSRELLTSLVIRAFPLIGELAASSRSFPLISSGSEILPELLTLMLTFAWIAERDDGTVEGGAEAFDMVRLGTPEAIHGWSGFAWGGMLLAQESRETVLLVAEVRKSFLRLW